MFSVVKQKAALDSEVTLRDQLAAQQKYLLRIEEMQCADWLICLSMSKLAA